MSKGRTSAGGMGGGVDRENKALKTALLVAGGLVVGWLTIETAFKPFLEYVRGAISNSDPARDPDDDADAGVFTDAVDDADADVDAAK